MSAVAASKPRSRVIVGWRHAPPPPRAQRRKKPMPPAPRAKASTAA